MYIYQICTTYWIINLILILNLILKIWLWFLDSIRQLRWISDGKRFHFSYIYINIFRNLLQLQQATFSIERKEVFSKIFWNS